MKKSKLVNLILKSMGVAVTVLSTLHAVEADIAQVYSMA